MSVSHVQNKSKNSLSKRSEKGLYSYVKDGTGFISHEASSMRTVYFPLCGINANGIKSSITPALGGDIKVDKKCYLTKPASVEDLRQGLRNFFCAIKRKGVFSFSGGNKQNSILEAGMLFHKLHRSHESVGLEMEALNFVPVTGENVELMRVTVKNISKAKYIITPTFNLPIFGRTLANKHDHEHVTSLLHRIEQLPNGICVQPTMVFDEHGHQANNTLYYVLGIEAQGKLFLDLFCTCETLK